jgi:Flp pilus assembly protein TadG
VTSIDPDAAPAADRTSNLRQLEWEVEVGSSRSARLHRRGARGQGLVEFALVAPLLITLAFGVFDFGRGMSANVTVTNSSREGARYLSAVASSYTSSSSYYGSACPGGTASAPTAPSDPSAQSKAWRQLAGANLDLTQVTMTAYFYASSKDPSADTSHTNYDLRVTCTVGGSPTLTLGSNPSYAPQTGDWVQYEVKYTFTPTTPVIKQLTPTVTMDQTTSMVLE